MYTAWRIDRGCSRVLEYEKPNLIQEPSSWLLLAVQSCYFIISWQHVLSCMNMYWPLIYHDGSNNVVQVCSFIKPWTLVCSNTHEQLSTILLHEAGQLNHVRFTMLLYPYRQYTILLYFDLHLYSVYEGHYVYFNHVHASLSTIMFKLASWTMSKPDNRKKQTVRFLSKWDHALDKWGRGLRLVLYR